MASRDNKRALKIIRALHTRQQKQGDQIQLLCRDMVSAHRDFSTQLAKLTFVTLFYELLFDSTDLNDLLNNTINGVRKAIQETDAAIILLTESGFEVHTAAAGLSDPVEKSQFRSWFTRELVNDISQMNRVCSMDQLMQMGLQGPPAIMKTISLAAIPLGRFGHGIGFALVYRPAHLPLRADELSCLAGISTGLSKAIQAHRTAEAKPTNKNMQI